MKSIVFVALASLFMFSSCIKSDSLTPCTNKTPASEDAQMVSYANTNGLAMVKHASGMYYQITNQGTGVFPTASSKVFVTYTGKLLNGNTFDSQSDASRTGFNLGNLIEGWRVGLPLIQKGGSIKLLVPSSMGYGCSGYATIPGNSILYFEISLVDVQ